jgi:hypothetical protein
MTIAYCVQHETDTTSGKYRDHYDSEEFQQQVEQLKLEYLERCEREARRTAFPPAARIRKQLTQRVMPVSERCSTRYPTGFG